MENSSDEGGRQPLQQEDDEENYYTEAQSADLSAESGSQPPLLEIPEEIYAVRKAALQVLKPLTKTWVSDNCDQEECAIEELVELSAVENDSIF